MLLLFYPIAHGKARPIIVCMDAPYEELRRQAAEKRDNIIAAAKQEYRVAMRRIRSLHKLMTGEYTPAIRPLKREREPSLRELLLGIVPSDRGFTVAEVCELAYSHEVACRFKENSIRSACGELKRRGELVQVGRHNGHILWAKPDAQLEPEVFCGMSLVEIAAQLIGEYGPMRYTEIVARMRERGYRPNEKPAETYDQLRRAMVRVSGRFVKDDGDKWTLTGD